ncbi:hypothetical protein Droror1_Dr00018887 [Drosera rotundifolia]
MEKMNACLCFTIALLSLVSSSYCLRPHPYENVYKMENYNHTMISNYRLINRKSLFTCPIESRYIQISAENITGIANEQFITVNISGVIVPAKDDWVAMISPSTSNIGDCPLDELMYAQTGDLSSLPLICHYPVKAQYVKNDPGYLSCQNSECQEYLGDVCIVKTCAASLTFHVVNIRTDIEFVFFAGGFITPCILKRSTPLKFANPNMPSFGHLSSIDSTATSMRLTWVSGDQNPQQIQYGNGQSQTSEVTTFTPDDMCSKFSVFILSYVSVHYPIV